MIGSQESVSSSDEPLTNGRRSNHCNALPILIRELNELDVKNIFERLTLRFFYSPSRDSRQIVEKVFVFRASLCSEPLTLTKFLISEPATSSR